MGKKKRTRRGGWWADEKRKAHRCPSPPLSSPQQMDGTLRRWLESVADLPPMLLGRTLRTCAQNDIVDIEGVEMLDNDAFANIFPAPLLCAFARA